uniref:Uncharacterized protein n=1 Tax=Castor canadensis TaxID=51338 RepID=A0A8C0XTG4_CASCN
VIQKGKRAFPFAESTNQISQKDSDHSWAPCPCTGLSLWNRGWRVGNFFFFSLFFKIIVILARLGSHVLSLMIPARVTLISDELYPGKREGFRAR